ncbi:MAG: hypothetical protein ACLQLG_12540 [Thermoguttaceae bacterium]
MLRRTFSFLVVLLVLAIAWSCWAHATPTTTFDPDQIKAVLHVGTPDDGHFVNWIVHRVNKGRFPADLFESTLLWAKKKPAHLRFQYFKRALIQRAAAVGIDLTHKPPT